MFRITRCMGFLWGVGIAILGLPYLPAQQGDAHPQAQLDTAISEAIRLLEKKDHVTLLKNFVAPDDLQKIVQNVPIEELAERFGKNHAEHLLKVLKSIQGKKPELDQEKKTATFRIDESLRLPMRDTLVFVQVNGLWYIRN
ncbi:MAG: hypothetical protein KatS3mg110_0860 [Pirellulaceae bacterium]|nr:MAG: hypothetical protein KatS3mg110_0860 [Pirellulaceae bacterium]